MKYFMTMVIFSTLLFTGCQNGGCIKIGGSYQDYDGNIEYCFDKEKSQSAGEVVLAKTNESGEKEEIYGMTGDEISSIVDELLGVVGKLDKEKQPTPKINRLREYLKEKQE